MLGYDVPPERGPARAGRGDRRARRPGRRAPAAGGLRRRARAQPPARRGRREQDELGSPQEHLHAFLRSLDAAAEGLPDRFVAAPRARARPLRHRGPGAHRGARGRRLPAVPLPARAATAREARARDPRPPPGAGHGAGSRASAACWTGWRSRSRRASPRWPSWRARCAGAAATSRGLESAREETYDEMAEHLPVLAEHRRRVRARAAHGRARRLPAAARAAADPAGRRRRPAGGGDDAPLLPHPRARGRRAADDRRRPVRALRLRARGRALPRRRDARRARTTCPAALKAAGELRGATRSCWPTCTSRGRRARPRAAAGRRRPARQRRPAWCSSSSPSGHGGVDVRTFSRGDDGALAEDQTSAACTR